MISIKQLSPEESLEVACDIVTIYRDVWLDIYVNDELGISRPDLESKFSDSNAVLTEKNVSKKPKDKASEISLCER